MPLVAHNNLPAFARLRERGEDVLSLDRAVHQDIRELHIGLLNMMPDAALSATEQQFITLVGSCNQIAQFYVYPFSLPELPRGAAARAHIAEHYYSFDALREQGLDALIISGANVANPRLEQEAFWGPLTEVVAWAQHNVASMLCSCLASHALLHHLHGIDRQRLPQKRWGVYPHRVAQSGHPLVRDINSRFDAPHSRYNEVTRAQFEQAGLRVLAESEAAGVHLAVSPDGFRVVYFQGHPEYDANSLLKEYKRDAGLYLAGQRERPPFPEHYFDADAQALANAWLAAGERAVRDGQPLPPFPEAELEARVDNTWRDTCKAVFNNWLGCVYRTTNIDRRRQFMDGVDPANPLGL